MRSAIFIAQLTFQINFPQDQLDAFFIIQNYCNECIYQNTDLNIVRYMYHPSSKFWGTYNPRKIELSLNCATHAQVCGSWSHRNFCTGGVDQISWVLISPSFLLWFAFSIIHGSRRAAKRWKAWEYLSHEWNQVDARWTSRGGAQVQVHTATNTTWLKWPWVQARVHKNGGESKSM